MASNQELVDIIKELCIYLDDANNIILEECPGADEGDYENVCALLDEARELIGEKT